MTISHTLAQRPLFQKSGGKVQERISTDYLSTTEWPKKLESPLSWSGSDFDDGDEKYTINFSDLEVQELEEGLAHFKNLDLHGSEVNRSNFRLPVLGKKLRSLSTELNDGRGFFVLRGLNPKRYSAEDNAILFLAVASHIADTRGKQDAYGNMLTHIQEASKMQTAQEARPARDSNVKLFFHSDLFTDILSIQVRECAAKGGSQVICSSYKIYNELSACRPDVLDLLAQPIWLFDSRNFSQETEKRPLLFYQNGKVILNFGRIHVMGEELSDDGKPLPKPTAQQIEALDVVQQIAERYQLRLSTEPGDITFFNNFALLHSRDAFENTPDKSRWLVRLWLKNRTAAWSLPRALQSGNERVFDETTEESWEIVPLPRVLFALRDKFGP